MGINRIAYLDQIRGLMILWMLVVHVSLNYGYIRFGTPVTEVSLFSLMSFFMTPFYFFSGYLFSAKRNFKDFTTNKIRKLLIPYLFFTMFGIIIYEAYSIISFGVLDTGFIGSFIPTAAFKTNTPCWFFISLFFVTEIYYLFHEHLEKTKLRVLICLFFFLAFMSCGRQQYLGHGNILLGLVYFHIGQELKLHEKIILKYWRYIFCLAILVYLLIGVFFPTSLSFVLNLLRGGNYVSNIIFSVSACTILYIIFSKLPQGHNIVGNCLTFWGETSLVIFAFHRPVLNWLIEPLVRFLYPDVSYSVFLTLCLILILTLAYLFNKAVNCFFPVVIGK